MLKLIPSSPSAPAGNTISIYGPYQTHEPIFGNVKSIFIDILFPMTTWLGVVTLSTGLLGPHVAACVDPTIYIPSRVRIVVLIAMCLYCMISSFYKI